MRTENWHAIIVLEKRRRTREMRIYAKSTIQNSKHSCKNICRGVGQCELNPDSTLWIRYVCNSFCWAPAAQKRWHIVHVRVSKSRQDGLEAVKADPLQVTGALAMTQPSQGVEFLLDVRMRSMQRINLRALKRGPAD